MIQNQCLQIFHIITLKVHLFKKRKDEKKKKAVTFSMQIFRIIILFGSLYWCQIHVSGLWASGQ